MRQKISVGLAVIVFLSLGSNLLADPVAYGYDNLTFLGFTTEGPPESAALLALGYSHLTYIDKWDGHSSPGNWSVTPSSGEFTEGTFVWNGSGVITHIVVKADGYYALFLLEPSLNPGDSPILTSNPTLAAALSGIENHPSLGEGERFEDLPNNQGGSGYAISHITGYGTTSVPEPATLILLGLGLMSVPLARRFTS